MSTKEQRDEWQRLSDAATAGWICENRRILSLSAVDPEYIARGREVIGEIHADGNRQFAIAAREAVPALLQDVERLTAELTTARNDVVFFAERLEKQDHQYSAAHPQAAIYRNRREELERSVASLTVERDAAITVADRQRTRAKDAEAELQRVKQERDTATARVDKAEAECAVWRREADAAAHAGLRAQERAEKAEADAVALAAKAALLDAPEIHDFAKAVVLEAAHQRSRWSTDHDAGKTDADWFWLIGYLAGKALHTVMTDGHKQLHRIITVAAAACNWHAASLGKTTMRPGIDATPYVGKERP